jgi:hypothetical protein
MVNAYDHITISPLLAIIDTTASDQEYNIANSRDYGMAPEFFNNIQTFGNSTGPRCVNGLRFA